MNPGPDSWPDRLWAEAIKRAGEYQLVKRVPPAHLVFLSPPQHKRGALRLDYINWDTYPDCEPVLVPVRLSNPEWQILGPIRHSVSLWMGPMPAGRGPSALIQFETATPVSVYTSEDRIQQVVLLTGE